MSRRGASNVRESGSGFLSKSVIPDMLLKMRVRGKVAYSDGNAERRSISQRRVFQCVELIQHLHADNSSADDHEEEVTHKHHCGRERADLG